MLGSFALVIVPVAIAGAILWVAIRQQTRQRPMAIATMFDTVAQRLGGRLSMRDNDPCLELEIDGFRVQVEIDSVVLGPDASENTVRTIVHSGGRWPSCLRLTWKASHGTERKARTESTFVSGDAAFDGAFAAAGWPLAMSALDLAARDALLAFPVAEAFDADQPHYLIARIVDSRFEVTRARRFMPLSAGRLGRMVVDEARAMIVVVRALDRRGRSEVEWLVEGVRSDPRARRRHLLALLELDAVGEIALAACREVLGDADPEVRLLAARSLGDEGRAELLALATGAAPTTASRLEALAAWEIVARGEQIAAGLGDLLKSKDADVRIAAIGIAERVRCREVLPDLVRLARHAVDARALALARALRAVGDASAEPALVHLLGAGNDEVQVEVVRALGAVGTVASVEPLMAITDSVLGDRAVRRAANDAIRAIQERAGAPDEGRLSIATLPASGGEVSSADDAAGRVSRSEA